VAEHELKTWPGPFEEMWQGRKLFEFRLNDRGYAVGDVLYLQEWDPTVERYTGRHIEAHVPYLLLGPAFGLPKDYVVMSAKVVQRWTQGSKCPDCGKEVPVEEDGGCALCGADAMWFRVEPAIGSDITPRCEVCDWPLASCMAQGCVPGNCSYRPPPGSPDHDRIVARRAELAAKGPDRA
jgi:hypothetical protein